MWLTYFGVGIQPLWDEVVGHFVEVIASHSLLSVFRKCCYRHYNILLICLVYFCSLLIALITTYEQWRLMPWINQYLLFQVQSCSRRKHCQDTMLYVTMLHSFTYPLYILYSFHRRIVVHFINSVFCQIKTEVKALEISVISPLHVLYDSCPSSDVHAGSLKILLHVLEVIGCIPEMLEFVYMVFPLAHLSCVGFCFKISHNKCNISIYAR